MSAVGSGKVAAGLPLCPVAAGWDNVMFRLGYELAVRLPCRVVAGRILPGFGAERGGLRRDRSFLHCPMKITGIRRFAGDVPDSSYPANIQA